MLCFCSFDGFAGNPDRQGEAGAAELLLNPWARSAGFHTQNTSLISGLEAMRLNVAGLVRMAKTQIVISNARYLEGTGINLNAVGVAQRMGKDGVLGLSLMAVDFGDIPVTTTDQPEGTGGTFSPNFFHLGLAYAHEFENKVSVGMTVRVISESTADLNATGIALDAGVQYVTGPQDNFRFGISLRNVGTPMVFGGEGLSFRTTNPDGSINYDLSFDHRGASFELPSVLNIGASYDFHVNPKHRITVLGNFTSNSFSRDALGGGVEYSFKDQFMLRGAYKIDLGETVEGIDENVYTGLSLGVSFQVPLGKNSTRKFGVDYAYRVTNPWSGTHNLSVRFDL
ncbi:MAG: PorV/PorQ family protein [Saprospiraceae bacterium]|nr:PorV/PorQ family protein [Saprospiraceae bacterium]